MSFVNGEQLFSPKKFSPKFDIYSLFQTVGDVKSSKFYKVWVPLGFGSTAHFQGNLRISTHLESLKTRLLRQQDYAYQDELTSLFI